MISPTLALAARPRWPRLLLQWGWLLAVAGCAVVPRLPLDVSVAVNRSQMRVLRTQHVDLYYPEDHKAEAYALAERAEGCLERLRGVAIGRGGLSAERVELLFPALPYNNAFVNPPFNGDFFSVVPTHWTMDITTETGLPPGPGYVACHELAHYVQAQQTFRTLGGLDRAFGYLVTPQVGLDAWFWEGLATYYEQRLQPHTGRPAWPAWKGMFHAAVAARGVSGGDLSALNRKLHWGNHYVYGSEFIAFLVERYSEVRLWQLVERQGRSFFFPFIINQRFKAVYGKTLSALLTEFDRAVVQLYPARARPAAQRTIRAVGMNGRYARASDGSEAVVSDAMDEPATLTVYDPNGAVRYRSRLIDVLPKRKVVQVGARMVSGLSFTRDGKQLYFTAVDRGLIFQEARLLRLDLPEGKLSQVDADLGGIGGGVRPDGGEYAFIQVTGHGHALAVRDLRTGAARVLFQAPRDVFLTHASYSQDGSKIVASIFEGAFAVAVFDARTGQRMQTLSMAEGPLFDATFLDSERLLFLGPHEGRFQLFTHELSSGKTARVSDVPYLPLEPRASLGTIRFLNREGFGYTLDEVQLPGAASTAAPPRLSALRAAPRTLADQQLGDGGVVPTPPTVDFFFDAGTSATGWPDGGVPGATTAVPVGSAPDAGAGSSADAGAVDAAAPPPSAVVVPEAIVDPALPRVQHGPVLALPLPPTTQLKLLSDEPYSAFPRVLIPSIRAPNLGIGSASGQNIVGFYLGGTDAFGNHRWGVSAGIQPFFWELSGSVGYLNAQLAPVLLAVSLSQLAFDEGNYFRQVDTDGDEKKDTRRASHDRHRQRDFTLTALLELRTTLLSLSLHATEDTRRDDPDVPENRALSGGTLGFEHRALEVTPMVGPRRGYRLAGSGSFYPEELGTLNQHVSDLRGELEAFLPLPFGRRHVLTVGLRARGVLAAENQELLEVGGTQGGALLRRPDRDELEFPGLPPKRRFRESLRGFETAGFTAERIGIVDLRYRYPIIIDRGTATSLWILPSFFLQQVDLELFASGAADTIRRLDYTGHLAVGGAVSVRFSWLAPLVLQYQLSKRYTDGRDLQHLLLLGTDI